MATGPDRQGLQDLGHDNQQIPYRDVEHAPILLPARQHMPGHARTPVPAELHIPSVF